MKLTLLALAVSLPVAVGVLGGASGTVVAGDPIDPFGTVNGVLADVAEAAPLPVKPKKCLDEEMVLGPKPPVVLHYCIPI